MKFLSTIIRGLPLDVPKADVQSYVGSFPGVAECVVGPIVEDVRRTSSSATVTFQSSRRDCEKIKNSLHGTPYHGSSATTLSVTDDFLGLTALSGEPDAPVHVYFVHGLGGHAFKTWSSEVRHDDITTLKNWPQDFLPERLSNAGVQARIYTIGYSANLMRSAAPDATVESAAENLLAALHGQALSAKPKKIYFICHSLGGLVICKALSMALFQDEDHPNRAQYKDIFVQDNECLVKGVVFMGTPFNGSGKADLFLPFIKTIRQLNLVTATSDNYLRALSTQQPVNISKMFRQAYSVMHDRNIKILVGCEERPVAGSKLVTTYKSATGTFGNRALVFRIQGRDHRQMVKFGEKHDTQYQMLEDNIVRMVKEDYASVNPAVRRINTIAETGYHPNGNQASGSSGNALQNITTNDYLRDRTRTEPHQNASATVQTYGTNGIPLRNRSPNHQQNFQPNPIPPPTATNSSQTLQGRRSPKESKFVSYDDDNNDPLNALKLFDTVFLIDDTGSMNKPVDSQDEDSRPRWQAARSALEHVANIAVDKDRDGVDLRFLIDEKEEDNITDINYLLDAFDSTQLDELGGGTEFQRPLEDIIRPRLLAFREYKREVNEYELARLRARRARQPLPSQKKPERPKFLNIIVLTDGAASDRTVVRDYIIGVAKELDSLKALAPQIGIQFVQVGDDADAAEFLRQLDDELSTQPDGQKIRDIVDTTPFDSDKAYGIESFEKLLEKVLLGAVTRDIDKWKNHEDVVEQPAELQP